MPRSRRGRLRLLISTTHLIFISINATINRHININCRTLQAICHRNISLHRISPAHGRKVRPLAPLRPPRTSQCIRTTRRSPNTQAWPCHTMGHMVRTQTSLAQA